MEALLTGRLASARLNQPGKKDKFKPHHLLKLIQVNKKGDAELITVKDFDLSADYINDQPFEAICDVNHWEFDGKSGQSCKVA